MRALILLFLFFAICNDAFGQRYIQFDNIGGGVNAPITNAAGNLISQGSSYVADLFYSTNLDATFDALIAGRYNEPFAGSGYFLGGSKTLVVFPSILAQVRAWDSNYGWTYYEARDHGGEFGFPNFIIVDPELAPGPPASLVGLQAFQLQRLPRLTSTATGTNTIVFLWPTEQTAYAMQQNSDVSSTNWATVPNTPITVGQNQQVILPLQRTGSVFYRLVSQ